ncbi:MAG: tRNA dihydrouridine synthase DusB [Nanoarchaeota archaeon]
MYKIGNVKLDSRVFLAPLAGINCSAFRLMCKEYGAGLVYSPMVVINQLVEAPERILEIINPLKQERPLAIQLVGSDTKLMEEAVKIIDEYADIIDINLGCPEKDILALKAGSFFIKHPDQLKKIIPAVMSNTNKPVTAKIRIGWDNDSINTLQVVKQLEDYGLSAIAVHARTQKQKYTGKADWNEIRKAKEIANIPIIGNGDIMLPGNAKAMVEQTKCDFVMIGRGAMGNPYLFKRASILLETGKGIPDVDEKEQKELFLKFFNLYQKYEKRKKFSELRQHAMWFTKGMKNSRYLRNKLLNCKTEKEILNYFK